MLVYLTFELVRLNFRLWTSEIQIFPNESFNFTLHRAGPFSWSPRTSWPKLPVSTNMLWAQWCSQAMGPAADGSLFCTVPYRFGLLGNQTTIGLINFTRNFHLNTVCRDICVEETSKCITTCDPTDSKCVNGCLRAELTCVESKQFYINKIPEYYTS